MVKFRGIDISIISQFDIRKLPEFRFRQTSPSPDRTHQLDRSLAAKASATASCYVPIYPGSHIWFEYSVDGPHPPKAAYFFKLLFNGKVVTSFDCGSNHNYHGKMMYNLVARGRDEMTGELKIVRQALHFSGETEHTQPGAQEDVIEFRVHRIEHRKRIRELKDGVGAVEASLGQGGRLQLTNGGILEPGFPQRRYKHQLLDPLDEPYATFKFFCRTHDYLEQHGIIDPAAEDQSSSASSEESQEPSSGAANANTADENRQDEHTHPISSPPEFSIQMVPSPSDTTDASRELGSQITLDKHNSMASDGYLPPSDSDEELSIVTKDSIEDLPSTVPRSPRSPRLQALADDSNDHHPLQATSSPMEPPRSPRRRLKKKLTINLNGAEFDLEKRKRPMSPFTSGGMLRKFAPPSAPAVVTEFGPGIHEEIEGDSNDDKPRSESQEKGSGRTTRAERGGRSLMGFLSRRVGTN